MSSKTSGKEKVVGNIASTQDLQQMVITPANGESTVSEKDWMNLYIALTKIAKDALNLVKEVCKENAMLREQLKGKENKVSSLEDNVQQYKEVNAALNVKVNNIHITEVEDKPKPTPPRKRGRPSGQPANKTFRPTRVDRKETLDMDECPECGKPDTLSGIKGSYKRIVIHTKIELENVEYEVIRRKCSHCKKKVSRNIPGVLPYARHDIIYEALMTILNLLGISHGKCAKLSGDALKIKNSRSSMYRAKIRVSKALRPDFEHVQKEILNERYVHADEIWWPIIAPDDDKGDTAAEQEPKASSGNDKTKADVPIQQEPKASSGNDKTKADVPIQQEPKASSGNDKTKKDPKNQRKSKSSGFVILILGEEHCLAIVSKTRKIPKLKEILPDYVGIVISDSLPNWLHPGGDHQMCDVHQKGQIIKTLKYQVVDEETAEFLNNLMQLHKGNSKAAKLIDQNARNKAADEIDAAFEELFARDYKDQFKIIARFRKRYRREKKYLTTHLRKNVPVDNNPIERTGRVLVASRNDGGGNRSEKGMEANSILFTNMLTDWMNKRSFFDHIVRSASGDG